MEMKIPLRSMEAHEMPEGALPPGYTAFDAYLRQASEGRNGMPRLVLGITLIVISYAIPIAVVIAAGSGTLAFDDLESRTGIALLLVSVVWLLPATAFALRLVHRRRPSSVLGVAGALSLPQYGRAFALMAIVLVAATLFGLLFDPRIDRGPSSLAGWATFAPLLAVLILLQTAAEEVFFRGYLVQTLALRFRTPLVWGGIPAILFTLLHWNAEISTAMNLAGLATVASFAIAATVLLVRTGNLGAAMGFHFANNIVALLFFSSSTAFNSVALFVLPPIESPEWSTSDAVLLAGVQIAVMVLVTILLIHRRSPLRIAPDAEQAAGLPRHDAASALPDR